MSKIRLNGRVQTASTLFAYACVDFDVEAQRQNLTFGGKVASALIGPDIGLPGAISFNPLPRPDRFGIVLLFPAWTSRSIKTRTRHGYAATWSMASGVAAAATGAIWSR